MALPKSILVYMKMVIIAAGVFITKANVILREAKQVVEDHCDNFTKFTCRSSPGLKIMHSKEDYEDYAQQRSKAYKR